MAFEKNLLIQGFTASSLMSAASMQYCFVELNSAGGVNLVNATTDAPIGVLQNTPAINQTAEVCLHGISKVRAAADTAIGDLIGADANGRAVILVSGTSVAYPVVGRVIAIDGTDNDGALVTAYINCTLSRNTA